MKFYFQSPSEQLAPYIKQYWILETSSSDPKIMERVIPMGTIDLMFHYKLPFTKMIENGAIAQPQTFISGLSDTFSDVSTSGESGVIAVTFKPGGASAFFGFSMAEIENCTIDLHDIYPAQINTLQEQIMHKQRNEDRIQCIENFLLKELNPLKYNELSLIQLSMAYILANPNNCKVTELSKQLNISTKTLSRKFLAFIGKTPRRFINIIRFQETLKYLNGQDQSNLAGFAYDHGYYDQSHFIHDFKKFTGYTPSQFLKLYPCAHDQILNESIA